MYWNTGEAGVASRHADALAGLAHNLLNVPEVRLGVDPKAAGLLLRAAMGARSEVGDAATERMFAIVGASPDEAVAWPGDLDLFGGDPEVALLRDILARGAAATDADLPNAYVWLNPSEARWWIALAQQALAQYAVLFGGGTDESAFLNLFIRHRCSFFASQTRRQFEAAFGTIGDPDVAARIDATTRRITWTWQLIDFSTNRQNLLFTPLLALWSRWPNDPAWSPAERPRRAIGGDLDVETAARLQREVFWLTLEELFSARRDRFGLGVAVRSLGDLKSMAPIFYLADFVEPPARTEVLLAERLAETATLVHYGLRSGDPKALDVAWGTLDGGLATARSETHGGGVFRPLYLLVPLAGARGRPLAAAADAARALSYFELSAAEFAHDILREVDQLEAPAGVRGGLLSRLEALITRGIAIVPILEPTDLARVDAAFRGLSFLLSRLQALVDVDSLSVAQLRITHHTYLDLSDDLLRRRMTIARLDAPGIRPLFEGLMDTYPFHYVLGPVAHITDGMELIRPGLERARSILVPVLQDADRRSRLALERAAQTLGLLAGLVGLVVGLPQLVPGAALTPATYPAFAAGVLPLSALEALTRVLIVTAFVGLAVLGAMTLAQLLRARGRGASDPFELALERLRALMQQAADAFRSGDGDGPALEQLDLRAADVLIELWSLLFASPSPAVAGRRARVRRQSALVADDWLQGAIVMQHYLALFTDLPTGPLPRSMCGLYVKSRELFEGSAVSERTLRSSLEAIGLTDGETDWLVRWLDDPLNVQLTRGADMGVVLDVLREGGVSADPELRTPIRWRGPMPITEEPAGAQVDAVAPPGQAAGDSSPGMTPEPP